MNTQLGQSVLWALVKANLYALFRLQSVYTERVADEYGIDYTVTLVATCIGSMRGGNLVIKKVFYEKASKQ